MIENSVKLIKKVRLYCIWVAYEKSTCVFCSKIKAAMIRANSARIEMTDLTEVQSL